MRGVIGFFDILGYRNFLENNSEIEYAIEIIKLMEFLPQHVVQSVKDGNFSPEVK